MVSNAEDGTLRDAGWGLAVRRQWRRVRECDDGRELESLYADLASLMQRVPPRLRIAFGGTITPPHGQHGRFRMPFLNHALPQFWREVTGMSSTNGLAFILKLLGGIHPYASHMRGELAAGEHYLPAHPFRRDFPGTTILIGSPGITASIAGFVYHFARRISRGLKLADLTRYRAHSGPDPRAFDLFYEAIFANETDKPEWAEALLVGGCTNYSGEGGAGTEEMEGLFALLSHLYGVRIADYTLPADAVRRVNSMLDPLNPE